MRTDIPDTLDTYRNQLHAAIERDLARGTRTGRLKRRALALSVPATAAAATTATVLLTAGGASGPSSASAAIIRHVRAELTAPPGQILHESATVTLPDGSSMPFELWAQTGGTGVYRVIKYGQEASQSDTKNEIYDASTNTVTVSPLPPAIHQLEVSKGGDPAAELKRMVESGQATATPTTYNGTPAYKLSVNSSSDTLAERHRVRRPQRLPAARARLRRASRREGRVLGVRVPPRDPGQRRPARRHERSSGRDGREPAVNQPRNRQPAGRVASPGRVRQDGDHVEPDVREHARRRRELEAPHHVSRNRLSSGRDARSGRLRRRADEALCAPPRSRLRFGNPCRAGSGAALRRITRTRLRLDAEWRGAPIDHTTYQADQGTEEKLARGELHEQRCDENQRPQPPPIRAASDGATSAPRNDNRCT